MAGYISDLYRSPWGYIYSGLHTCQNCMEYSLYRPWSARSALQLKIMKSRHAALANTVEKQRAPIGLYVIVTKNVRSNYTLLQTCSLAFKKYVYIVQIHFTLWPVFIFTQTLSFNCCLQKDCNENMWLHFHISSIYGTLKLATRVSSCLLKLSCMQHIFGFIMRSVIDWFNTVSKHATTCI